MSAHVSWPAERFYWCVLDAPGWKRSGPLPEGLRPLLDDELPVRADDLHSVCTPLPPGLLVCAAPVLDLQALPPGTLSLTPSQVPPFAQEAAPAALNLLTGALEPGVVRRARMRTHVTAAAAMLACALLLSLGLLRRGSAWTGAAAQAGHEAGALVALVAGQDGDLQRELDLARAHEVPLGDPAPDSGLALSAVLAGWPSSVNCTAQSISVDREGASVSVSVEGDPAPFLEALRPPAGWRLDEPRLNSAGGVTRVSLRLRPTEGAAP